MFNKCIKEIYEDDIIVRYEIKFIKIIIIGYIKWVKLIFIIIT